MSQPSNSAVRGSPASSAAAAPPVAATGDFVVNLCASTTPMALEKPSSPELARYTFFVSRRREEGRERFRLHMGYFATREDAEQMLLLVRDLYPAAWVGETPGRKLASSATARASAPVTPAAVTPRAAPAPVPAQSAAPPLPVAPPKPAAAKVEPRAAVPPASNVREVLAALEPEAEAPASTSRTRTRTRTIGDTGVTVAMPILQGSLMAAAAAPTAVATPSPPVSPQARPTPAASAAFLPTSSRAAVPPTAASAVAPAAAKSAGPATTPTAPVSVPAVRTTSPGADMTDSQVLRVLEGRNNAAQACVPASAEGRDIALLSPQDTQTWRDIKAQIKRDAVVHFAVQLNWSVTPIDLARVPSLAIFNAYTLYKIEGNREGRKWYGLRLGFFSDAVSAKQVAQGISSANEKRIRLNRSKLPCEFPPGRAVPLTMEVGSCGRQGGYCLHRFSGC